MQWAAYEPMAPSGMPAMSSMGGMGGMSGVELPSQQVVQVPQERQQPENQVRKIQAPEMPYVPQPQQPPAVNVPEPKKKSKTDLADISESDEPTDLLYVVVAAFIGVVALLIVVRAFPEIFGKNLNLLFNRFKMVALLGYVFMLCVVIGVARYVYSEFLFLSFVHLMMLFCDPTKLPYCELILLSFFLLYPVSSIYSSREPLAYRNFPEVNFNNTNLTKC